MPRRRQGNITIHEDEDILNSEQIAEERLRAIYFNSDAIFDNSALESLLETPDNAVARLSSRKAELQRELWFIFRNVARAHNVQLHEVRGFVFGSTQDFISTQGLIAVYNRLSVIDRELISIEQELPPYDFTQYTNLLEQMNRINGVIREKVQDYRRRTGRINVTQTMMNEFRDLYEQNSLVRNAIPPMMHSIAKHFLVEVRHLIEYSLNQNQVVFSQRVIGNDLLKDEIKKTFDIFPVLFIMKPFYCEEDWYGIAQYIEDYCRQQPQVARYDSPLDEIFRDGESPYWMNAVDSIRRHLSVRQSSPLKITQMENLNNSKFDIAFFDVKKLQCQLSDETVKGDAGVVIVRDDTNEIIARHSSKYQLVRHREAVEVVMKELLAMEYKVDFTGALMFGTKKSSMRARFTLPKLKAFTKRGGDEFFPMIDIVNSYDGLLKFKIEFGLYKQVCSNGLLVAMEGFHHIYKKVHIGESIDLFDMQEWTKKWVEETFPILVKSVYKNLSKKKPVEVDALSELLLSKEREELFAEFNNLKLFEDSAKTRYDQLDILTSYAQRLSTDRRIAIEKRAYSYLMAV